jgi:putative transposase
LARKLFKYILKRWLKPSFKKIAMHSSNLVAVVEENERSKSFNKWLRLSTLERRKRVLIPLKITLMQKRLRQSF